MRTPPEDSAKGQLGVTNYISRPSTVMALDPKKPTKRGATPTVIMGHK
jgi:hypothetical protein